MRPMAKDATPNTRWPRFELGVAAVICFQSSRKQLWVGHVFFRFSTSGLQELIQAEARHSCLVQKPRDLLSKDRQLGLDDVPHEALVDIRISVNQDVAEGNNAAVLPDARHDFF